MALKYPAETFSEAVDLAIDGGNKLRNFVNGDINTEITTDGGVIPSVAKALNESSAYKTPIAWNNGDVQTDLMQPRDYQGVVYVPRLVPVTLGAAPTLGSGGDWRFFGDAILRQELVQPVATFNNVADMKADSTLVIGRKIRTLGYYTPGDGGGNDYEIVAAGTGTDDGGSFLDLSGSGLQAKGLFVDGVVNVKQFGAVGDGVTDDTVPIATALAAGSVLVNSGVYDTGGLSVSLLPPELSGTGVVKTSVVDQVVFSVGGGARLSGCSFHGLTFEQPNSQTMSGGEANNHFALKLFAVDDSRLSNLKFNNVDLCLGFEYGSIALGDRSCFRNTVSNVIGYGIRGMGLQLFGSKQGSFTNLTFEGTDFSGTPGGKALFHGLRLNALSSSVNYGNIVELSAKNFSNGVSLQQNSYYNTVTLYAENCTNAVNVHGQSEGVTTGVSTNNTFNINAKDCDYVVYDGGSSNTFNINADGCIVGGIFADSNGGVSGLAENNRYIGTIRNTVGRLADIRSSNSSIDLTLEGVGSASTFGLLLQGYGCIGDVVVTDCNVGVSVTGNNNNISADVRSTVGDALQVSGSNNTIAINTDGDVLISGDNNTIIGYIGGNVTNTGTGNKFDFSGTMSPILKGTVASGAYVSGGNDTGTWVREGRTVKFYIRLNGTITGQSGALAVTGLPFQQSQSGFYFYLNETAGSEGFVFPRSISGSTAKDILLLGQQYTSGDDIYISGSYIAN